jgi:exonuclease SbcC
LQDLGQQIDAQTARLAACESVLERREQIEDGYGHLARARDEEAQYSVKLSGLLTLVEDRTRLETAIAEAKKALEVQRHVITGRMGEWRKLAEQLPLLQAEHTRVAAELEGLAALRDQAEAGRQSIGDLSEEGAALEAHNEQLKAHMATLTQNLTQVQEPTPTCPLCGQDLTEDDRQRLIAQFEEEGSEQGDLYRSNAHRREEIDRQIASVQSEVERVERELRRLPALQGREARLQESVLRAQEATAKLEEQQHLLDSLQEQLERGAFAEQEQGQLAELDARISALGYDRAAHDKARQTLRDLSPFEADKAELDRALQTVSELRANLQQLAKTREQWGTSLDTDRQRYAELSTALGGVDELSRDLAAKQQEVDELRGKEGHARQVLGAAQQKLDHCSYLTGEREDRSGQLRALAEERSLYDELRVAFGKRGMQALIIENVLPELEDEANRLLHRMTDGRMSVCFETQHDTKSGAAVETLDIRISDEHGPRSYEMYSGGEAFRIDFAIRIALSKLLARRAGAQLQTLIIDEGFGTQDAAGRQRLVEAINSIRDEFALIVAITHIEELKDAFPVRIDVYKTPLGSQISIS